MAKALNEFDTFWAMYPRRTGKIAAQKEFTKARKLASLEEILAGVTRYIATKPDYADWCHPRTFLAQGRWMDEPDRRIAERRVSQGGILLDCPHTPPCVNRWTCGSRQLRERAAS